MNRLEIAALGRRVAAYEDLTLWDLPRPSTSERLAGVRRKQAALARLQPATSPLWSFALAACAAAVVAAADVPPLPTAGCGGMQASSMTAGTAGSGG